MLTKAQPSLLLMTLIKKNYRVLIADDHGLILDGLKKIIQEFEEVDRVEAVNDKFKLMHALQHASYDILFLDIHFGDFDGRDLAKEIRTKYPDMILAAFTSFDDRETIQSTIHAGFHAFFLKSDDISEIAHWLKAGNFSTTYISTHTKLTYSEHSLKVDRKSRNGIHLSDREKEVLRLILEEYTSKQIAETMNLSEKTIENYRSNLMLKLEVTNIAGLVKKAILQGLLT
jgi:DNA-binding NarL/FixJ family response regulator